MGDYYFRLSQTITDTTQRNQNLEQAAQYYSTAVKVAVSSELQSKIGFLYSLGNVYRLLNQPDKAIQVLEQGIALKPTTTNLYKFEITLADIYYKQKDNANSLLHAQNALAIAPDNQKQSVQDFITNLESNP